MALKREILGYHSHVVEGDYDFDRDEAEDDYVDPRYEWRDSTDLDGCHLGIELETVTGNGGQDVVEAMPAHHTERDGPAPMFERDGSLPIGGVEIIFPPYPPEEFFDGTSYISRAIDNLQHVRTWEQDPICGMHFNVNSRDLTLQAQRIFCAVFYSMPTRVMEGIGGRALNQYCGTRVVGPNDRVKHFQPAGSMHRYCVEQCTNRIECRFPAATRDIGQIRKLVTLFTAVREYAVALKPTDEMLVTTMYERFMDWLKATKKEPYVRLHAVLRGF